MKKILKFLPLLLLGLFVSVSFSSCSDDDDDKPVAETELPKAANSFLNLYYPGVKIAKVTKETENGSVEYNVTMSNVHKITFDSTGDWLDVDAPAGQYVTRGFFPEAICVYLVENYGKWEIINEISKEVYGYEVELITGQDLHFNSEGQFIAQEAH